MRRIMLAVLLLAFPIVAIFGCKKGGPAQPYDAKLPNTTGNMVVEVVRMGKIQQGVTIKITDYLGSVFSNFTGEFGMTSFNFDYAKYSVDQAAPSFKIEIPKQEYYNDTICNYVLKNGPNTFLFTNDPILSVAPSSGMPLSYSYNITNNICYNPNYDKGGNGDIPISLLAVNVPSGWTVNYENRILGGSVTQTAVTFIIPQGEYRQYPISFLGYYANNASTSIYASSSPFTITRAFQIGLGASTAVTTNSVDQIMACGFTAYSANGGNVTWNYYYKLTGEANGNCGTIHTYCEKNGTFLAGATFNWSDVSEQICDNTAMNEILHIWNADVGDYYYSGSTSSLGAASKSYSLDHGAKWF
jgi:hypothetical protein